MRKLRVIDLFSGCGGLALGFERAGFETVYAVDNDLSAVATFNANINPVAECKDIKDVHELPDADVIVGGPPCQGFSNLGTMNFHDPRNQLWEHYFRLLEQKHPRAFLLENVPPFLSSLQGTTFCQQAARIGYRTYGTVLNSADFGVPQTRKRTIIIGLAEGVPYAPTPLYGPLGNSGQPWRTVREAFSGLSLTQADDPANWHFWRVPTDFTLARMQAVPPGGNRWDLYKARPDLTPQCWIRKTQGGTDLFGRLWWDRPSVTIRTEFYKPEKGRYLHPSEDRGITWREAMRIQTFPDDFVWHGTRPAVARQIGNAVPPLLAEQLAQHLARLLAGEASPLAQGRLALMEPLSEYQYA